jgi:hypothetical protein
MQRWPQPLQSFLTPNRSCQAASGRRSGIREEGRQIQPFRALVQPNRDARCSTLQLGPRQDQRFAGLNRRRVLEEGRADTRHRAALGELQVVAVSKGFDG